MFEKGFPLNLFHRVCSERIGQSDGRRLDRRLAILKHSLDSLAEDGFVQLWLSREQPEIKVVFHPGIGHAKLRQGLEFLGPFGPSNRIGPVIAYL